MRLYYPNRLGRVISLPVHWILVIVKLFGLPHLGVRMRHRLVASALRELHFPPHASILDAGCGYGFTSVFLARYGFRVAAIDRSAARMSFAKKLARFMKVSVSYTQSTLEKLPYQKNSFDLCVSLEVLEHVASPLEVLRELARVTKNDGYLILSIPETISNVSGFRKLHHVTPGFTIDQLNVLLKKTGYSIVKIYPYSKTAVGKIVFNINTYLSGISPFLCIILFPLFYLLLHFDLWLPLPQHPTNFVLVTQRRL